MPRLTLRWLHFLLATCLLAAALDVPISSEDPLNQVCSGMWGGSNAYINVTFDTSSQGQLALVIYEWQDVHFLGKVTSATDTSLPRTYICTTDAVLKAFCTQRQLGQFIVDLPPNVSQDQTSIWTSSVAFTFHPPSAQRLAHRSLLDSHGSLHARQAMTNASMKGVSSMADSMADAPKSGGSSGSTMYYKTPLQYPVRYTGYYCVAVVPVTVMSGSGGLSEVEEDVLIHPPYHGNILFKNTFEGKLAATDYPKVELYFVLFLVYLAIGAAWGYFCWRHFQDLLPIQHYISSLVGFLIIEMVAHWAYYRYLNARGNGMSSTAFLIVVAILDAGRNALSFFLLLIVALGLSVVRQSLGISIMRRCQVLALLHFIFGVLYGVGIVELQLESTSALVLLLFVIPLAFTLSTFLLWIMYALNGTIAELAQRKQRYKLKMFKRLYWILVLAVATIMVFFVVSSMAFSNRLEEDYAANSWKYRWWLLDGWLAVLYLIVFTCIAYIWRPSENNRRLAMSDELAQDEEDAEDYDLEALERRGGRVKADDESTLVEDRRRTSLGDDGVVFEIGDGQDSDEDDDELKHRHHPQAKEEDREDGHHEERRDLMGNGDGGGRHD